MLPNIFVSTVGRGKAPEDSSMDTPVAAAGWLRGLAYDKKEDLLFLGSSPAEIIVLTDILTEPRVIKTIKINDDICESVFDILPE